MPSAEVVGVRRGGDDVEELLHPVGVDDPDDVQGERVELDAVVAAVGGDQGHRRRRARLDHDLPAADLLGLREKPVEQRAVDGGLIPDQPPDPPQFVRSEHAGQYARAAWECLRLSPCGEDVRAGPR